MTREINVALLLTDTLKPVTDLLGGLGSGLNLGGAAGASGSAGASASQNLNGLLSSVSNLADLTVTSDGVTATLSSLGVTVNVPLADLSKLGLAGNVVLPNGTHLVVGNEVGDNFNVQLDSAATYGMGGDDVIVDSASHGYVYGGSGADNLAGGDGNDHLYGYGPTAGMDGADTIHGNAGDDYIQGNAGDDILSGDEGNDRVNGGSGADTIAGGDGDDTVNGNFGSDTIDGGAGNDTLRGGKDDDIISGGAGDDQLWGDLGSDTVTGGAGADTFHFAGNSSATLSLSMLLDGVDTITDFTDGQDHIALDFKPTDVLHSSASSVEGLLGTVQTLLGPVTSLLSLGQTNTTVAAVSVGSDTYLVYGGGGGMGGDSIVKLTGVADSSITVADFV